MMNENIRSIVLAYIKRREGFLKRSMGLGQSRHVVHIQRIPANGRRDEQIAETLAVFFTGSFDAPCVLIYLYSQDPDMVSSMERLHYPIFFGFIKCTVRVTELSKTLPTFSIGL
jgi:hypothetical protein